MENIKLEQETVKGKWVTPIGEYNAQSYPIVEDKKYFITDEELEKLGKHELKWAYEEETIQVMVDNLDNPLYDEAEMIIGYEKKLVNKVITKCSLIPNDNSQEILISNAKQEIIEIHKWLSDNDWKFNKVFLGEWAEDDTRWLEYLEERRIKRARLDYLELTLKEAENA